MSASAFFRKQASREVPGVIYHNSEKDRFEALLPDEIVQGAPKKRETQAAKPWILNRI
jgi:hypothetical protein